MSVVCLVQGYTGISWPKDVLGFCLHLEWEYFKHSSLLRISFWRSSFKPGQYTVSFALSLHLAKPKCPSCIRWRIAWHFLLGMTIHMPFKAIQSSTVISSQKVQDGWISLGTYWIVLGHWYVIVCFNKENWSSSCVAILISCKLSLLAFKWLVIWWTWSLGNLIESFCLPRWDKQSKADL